MYRFLLRPRWLLLHLLVLVLVVVMVNLGLWQLRRLDERRTYNDEVRAAQQLPAEPIDVLLPAGPASTPQDVDAIEFRQVELRGTYAHGEEVLVRNRTYNGAPGYWVITPLVLGSGDAVAVNRGWVPFNTTDPDGSWDAFAPPPGEVRVTGMVREPQVRSSGIVEGPADAAEGELRTLARVDVARLAQQSREPFYPVFVDLRTQEPAPGDLPLPVPEPELGEGNHLSYAGQWFIFATLLAVLYPLWLRRQARTRQRESRTAPAGDEREPVAAGS